MLDYDGAMAQRLPLVRRIVFILFLVAIATAAGLLLGTEHGRELLQRPHGYGARVREWVHLHPLISPAIYLAALIGLGMLILPVWWLEILGGYGFGLWMGVIWTVIASTIAAAGAAALSRFLLADWFRKRVESHVARLRKIDSRLGHNGLLAVSLVRLLHFIPFGPANVVFGISQVSLRDVAIGTLFGNIPSVLILVTTGAAPHLFKGWRFWIVWGVLNLGMLGAIALRYLRPDWFRSIGVE